MTIPANATQATLTYWYRITTQETGNADYDVMTLQAVPSSGSITTLDIRANNRANSSYEQRSIDMMQFVGKQILIAFAAQTDNARPTVFRSTM